MFIGGTVVAFNVFAINNEEKKNRDACCSSSSTFGISEDHRRKAFNNGAAMYDDDIGTDELVMGLPSYEGSTMGAKAKGESLK